MEYCFKKANGLAGYCSRNVTRPPWQSCVLVWAPHCKIDVYKLERVQRRAVRVRTSLKKHMRKVWKN